MWNWCSWAHSRCRSSWDSCCSLGPTTAGRSLQPSNVQPPTTPKVRPYPDQGTLDSSWTPECQPPSRAHQLILARPLKPLPRLAGVVEQPDIRGQQSECLPFPLLVPLPGLGLGTIGFRPHRAPAPERDSPRPLVRLLGGGQIQSPRSSRGAAPALRLSSVAAHRRGGGAGHGTSHRSGRHDRHHRQTTRRTT